MSRIVIVTFILFIAIFPAPAKEPLRWCKTDQPPFYTLDGTGLHDRMVDYLVTRLGDYQHSFQHYPIQRILNMIRDREKAVWLGLYKSPEREKYIIYHQIPLFYNLTTVLVVKRSQVDQFKPYVLADGKLDLEKLLQTGKFHVGYTVGRGYSGIIDTLIQKYQGTGILYGRASTDTGLGLMQMVVHKRLDAFFEVPLSIKPSLKEIGATEDEITALTISKLNQYDAVYVGMPYNEWGQSLANKIDVIMKEKNTIELFASWYEGLLDNSLRSRYQKDVQALYRTIN